MAPATVGVLTGHLCSLFLIVLEMVTNYRLDNPWVLWLCPVVGLVTGLAAARWDKVTSVSYYVSGTDWRDFSLWCVPLLIVLAWAAHLGGASVGREGVAVVLGGAVSLFLVRIIEGKNALEQGNSGLVACGLAAGFSAAFGAPWAAALFAFEITRRVSSLTIFQKGQNSTFSLLLLLQVLAASFLAGFVSRAWSLEHFHLQDLSVPFSFQLLLQLVFCGAVFGLLGRIFLLAVDFFNKQIFKFIPNKSIALVAVGFVFPLIYLFTESQSLFGLGVERIERSFGEVSGPFLILEKLLLTALSMGVGFKGGEATPLFYMGSNLGSVLSLQLQSIPLPVLAGLGYVAVFSSLAGVPLTGIVLLSELFGMQMALAGTLVCSVAYWVGGSRRLYETGK